MVRIPHKVLRFRQKYVLKWAEINKTENIDLWKLSSLTKQFSGTDFKPELLHHNQTFSTNLAKYVMQHIERGTFHKLHVSHFIGTILINANPCPLFIFWLYVLLGWYQPSILNPSIWKICSKTSINKTTNNMANIDHYTNEMRHMSLPQSPPFDVLHHIYLQKKKEPWKSLGLKGKTNKMWKFDNTGNKWLF